MKSLIEQKGLGNRKIADLRRLNDGFVVVKQQVDQGGQNGRNAQKGLLGNILV